MEKENEYIKEEEIHSKWANYVKILSEPNFELRSNKKDKYFLRFNDVIGENEASAINQLIKKIKKEKIVNELIIEFKKVRLITPVFVSNIFLISRLPINIKLFTPYEEPSTYQLMQFFGNDFFEDKQAKKKVKIFRKSKISDNYYLQEPTSVISQSYFPSIIITDTSFNEYFFETYNFKKNDEDIESQIQKYTENQLSKSELYNLYCELLLNDIGISSEYILNEQKHESPAKKLYATITNHDIYFNQNLLKRKILNRLNNKTLLHLMLLRLILINSFQWKNTKVKKNEIYIVGIERSTLKKTTNELTEKNVKGKTVKVKVEWKKSIDKFVDFLFNLFENVESFIPGIYEISKNVIQHSSNNTGALSIRIFSKKDIEIVKNLKSQYWSDYFNKQVSSSINNFLDLSIIDDGESGIFDTLYKSFKKSIFSKDYGKEINREKIDHDLRKLTEIVNIRGTNLGSELYQRLFQLNDNHESPFTFQLKKASAGYGLVVFAANIYENKGCYQVNSYSNLQNIQYGFFKGTTKKIHPFENGKDLTGTHYNFVLPLNPKKKSDSKSVKEFEFNGISDDDIFKSLRDIKLGISKSSFTNLPYGISYKIDKIILDNKNELALYTFEDSSKIIDRSELLRFLAKINLSSKIKSHIIVYNLNIAVLENLVDLLRILYIYFHKNFWSDPKENSQSILFYCKNNETNLFSTFLLCGKSLGALLAVNRKISYYQFVDIPFEHVLEKIKKSENKNENYSEEIHNILKTPFFIKEHPIFFDMVIKATKYHTLFESNVHELLTKEIV